MKCFYCRTENAFAEYHRHPSASSVLAASVKFSEFVRLHLLPEQELTRFIKELHACPRHGNEVGCF